MICVAVLKIFRILHANKPLVTGILLSVARGSVYPPRFSRSPPRLEACPAICERPYESPCALARKVSLKNTPPRVARMVFSVVPYLYEVERKRSNPKPATH